MAMLIITKDGYSAWQVAYNDGKLMKSVEIHEEISKTEQEQSETNPICENEIDDAPNGENGQIAPIVKFEMCADEYNAQCTPCDDNKESDNNVIQSECSKIDKKKTTKTSCLKIKEIISRIKNFQRYKYFKYLVLSLLGILIIGFAIHIASPKLGDYVYLSSDKGTILHTAPNCKKINHGSRRFKTSDIKKDLKNGSYVRYCSECTNERIIDEMENN